MAYEEERVTVRSDAPVATGHGHAVEETRVGYRPSGVGMLERLVFFIFGLIQVLLLVRIVFLLLAARESNSIVSFVYELSEIFVAPFRGILGRDEIAAGATELDITAIVALIGWTILEFIILALVRIFRPSAVA
jgi:uncharacterized protein YggT (Ycf19 family)